MLISGASGGVGEGIATACGEAGWEVWVAARRSAEGMAVAEEVDRAGGTGRFVPCDVGVPGAVAAVVEAVTRVSGGLDGLVHNATSGWSSRPGPIGEVSIDEVKDQVLVGLRGPYLLSLGCYELLRASGSGSVVFLTSEAGFEGKPTLAPYAMVKAAERGLARVLSREWGPSGVRVNAVAPLATSPAMDRFCEDPGRRARVLERIPLGRLGDPHRDIGPVVRFLLSDDSRFVTGQTIMADGGSCPIV